MSTSASISILLKSNAYASIHFTYALQGFKICSIKCEEMNALILKH